MPSFGKAVPYLIASFAMMSSITNTVVCTNDFKFTTRRETRKTSKKNEAPRGCTYHNFVGSSKYVNCRDIVTEIKIECGDKDADDTTRMCKVTEHPWNDEQKEVDMDAAAAVTACVVHGSFDPYTHITTDSATGSCHLKFLPLFDSCDVDTNGSSSGVFGMKAEILNSRNTENDNDDNSGMLLRFSHNGGAKYYNDNDPRETVPLHDVLPAERKLTKFQSCFSGGCNQASGTFVGTSTSTYFGMSDPFETCYQFGDEETYCWTKSFYYDDMSSDSEDGDGGNVGYFQCVPNEGGEGWHKVDPPFVTCLVEVIFVCVVRSPSCGPPCQGQHEDDDTIMAFNYGF